VAATLFELEKTSGGGPVGLLGTVPLQIECNAFTGTLGTLVQAVRNHKVELLDVPLAPICEAYFLYLLESQREDLDLIASALAPLAYLVERKAFHLIPVEVEETEEYYEEDEALAIEPTTHQFDDAIRCLTLWQEERERTFFRSAKTEVQYEIPFELKDVEAGDLALVLERLLKRAVPEPPDALRRPRRSLTEQMDLVARVLPADWQLLETIVTEPLTRQEIVWWFLALLELIRLGQARVRVEGEEIYFAGGAACSA